MLLIHYDTTPTTSRGGSIEFRVPGGTHPTSALSQQAITSNSIFSPPSLLASMCTQSFTACLYSALS